MNTEKCSVCQKNKTAVVCGLCDCLSCKKCSYFTDETTFEYTGLLPAELQDKSYCPNCYHGEVAETLEQYQQELIQAREVDVYMMNQTKETRLFDKKAKALKVTDCYSEEDVLMQLAFLAVRKGFNTIINVAVKSSKEKITGNYTKLVWQGTCIPLTRQKRR